MDPKCGKTFNALASLKESLGEFAEAEIYYKKALDLDETSLSTKLNLLYFYISPEKYSEAEELVTAFPTINSKFYQLLGKLKLAQKDPDAALEALLKAEAIEPNPPEINNIIGGIYYRIWISASLFHQVLF